jgi:cytochrome c-type biogenesis protein CcmF
VVDIAHRGRRQALSAAALAAALAHAGLGVTLMGIAGVTLWKVEALEVLGPNETMPIGGYSLRLVRVGAIDGPNYRAERAIIEVREGPRPLGVLTPERRLFPAEGQETVQTAIRTTGFSDLYVALGDNRGGARWAIRAYVNPLAPLIWFGGLIMALGGLASLWGRLRAMFPAKSRVQVAAE